MRRGEGGGWGVEGVEGNAGCCTKLLSQKEFAV